MTSVLAQALDFAQSQAYHAFSNNCIATSDFLVRGPPAMSLTSQNTACKGVEAC